MLLLPESECGKPQSLEMRQRAANSWILSYSNLCRINARSKYLSMTSYIDSSLSEEGHGGDRASVLETIRDDTMQNEHVKYGMLWKILEERDKNASSINTEDEPTSLKSLGIRSSWGEFSLKALRSTWGISSAHSCSFPFSFVFRLCRKKSRKLIIKAYFIEQKVVVC